MLKNIYFWVITAVLLIVIGLSALKILPPILASYQENQLQIADAKTELARQNQLLAAVNAVKQDETGLDEVYSQAVLALPASADSEILMLQLDGLLKSLGISTATISVPLKNVDPTEDKAASDAKQNEIETTISGKIDYAKTKSLLGRLKTFARWNTIKNFNITRSGDEYNTSVVFTAYVKPGRTGEFSGNSAILAQAKEVFANVTSYATNPDVGSEGSYGRNNPFTD